MIVCKFFSINVVNKFRLSKNSGYGSQEKAWCQGLTNSYFKLWISLLNLIRRMRFFQNWWTFLALYFVSIQFLHMFLYIVTSTRHSVEKKNRHQKGTRLLFGGGGRRGRWGSVISFLVLFLFFSRIKLKICGMINMMNTIAQWLNINIFNTLIFLKTRHAGFETLQRSTVLCFKCQ